jgi:hypothetical protein
MSGWRARQVRAALVASINRRGPGFVGVILAVALSAATFAFASVQVFGGDALAATPNLTTVASSDTEIGLQIFDNANLMGGAAPTGSILFNLYGPGDTTCSTSIFNSTVPVAGAGSYNSASYTTTQAGTYQWRAAYSGDANNDAVSTACNDPAEDVIVGKARTVLTTTASGPVAVGGGPIFDTAHLRGGFNPTGTITFELSGPADTICSADPVFTDTVTVNGNGDYQSAGYSPTAPGLYKWRARYDGDTNNLGDGPTACLDPLESVLVTAGLLTPTLTTVASPSVAAGGQVHDTATLAGGLVPTGNITFNLYGPDDATCAGPLAGTSTVPVSGNGTYQSSDITVADPGTYRFVASYSGDVAHNPVTTACNDPAETVVVTSGPGSTTSTSTSTTTPGSTTSTTSTIPTSTSTTVVPSTTTTSTTSPTSTSTTSTTAPTGSTSTTQPTGSTTSTTQPTGSTTSTTSTSTTTPGGSTSTSSTTAPGGSTTSTSAPGGSTSTTSGGGSTTTTSTTSTTTTVPPVPSGTTTVPLPQPTVGVTPSSVAPGQNVTVFGSGFPANSPLDILLFSTPVLLGTTTADASGSFRTVVTIPPGTAPGVHRLVVVVRGGTVQAETTLTVISADSAVRAAPTSVAVATVAPRQQLSRTGSDPLPARFAGGLLVVGLLMVGGARLGGGGRFQSRWSAFFQHPPTG